MSGSAEETAAFRQSAPDGPLGRKGRIVLRADGCNYQFAVDQLQPKSRQPLGKTGLEIELVKFDPTFLSVQLLVHRGKEEPQRMFLLADLPEYDEQDGRHGVFGSYWFDAQPENPAAALPMRRRFARSPGRGSTFCRGRTKSYWRGWRRENGAAGKCRPRARRWMFLKTPPTPRR